jgi:hypothetical protein
MSEGDEKEDLSGMLSNFKSVVSNTNSVLKILLTFPVKGVSMGEILVSPLIFFLNGV